ncbi:hypothetical protein [Aliikangiella sp. IMCC44359]|uniref:hypothetical protein n=1 Tax=Aliikangiella sp. IMCC44359 TaxID=3459125 RepID=UPI00403AAFFB
MSQASSLQSLHLILEDITAEINHTAQGIEAYAKAPAETHLIEVPIEHINRLKGVFTLLEFIGGQVFSLEMLSLLKKLPQQEAKVRRQQMDAASTALVKLIRYIEHISQKAFELPELLIPTINELRVCNNVSLLSESAFFKKNINKVRPEKDSVFVISEESAGKSRHFRQMYQIGLIEVLRQTNLIGGLEMMKKALNKLDEDCLLPKCPNLWWIAESMLDGFIANTLQMTKTRLKLFSQIDRQIRRVENKPEFLLNDAKVEMNSLANEMLYLVSISGVKTDKVQAVLQHFDVKDSPINDKLLRQESCSLHGLSNQDYHSIIEALVDEIEGVESLHLQGKEIGLGGDDLVEIKNKMVGLNNLLKILQIDDQIVRLTVTIDLVDKAVNEHRILSEKESSVLAIALSGIKQSVRESGEKKYSGLLSSKRDSLSKVQLKVCEETHQKIKQFILNFSDFINNNRKAVLLKGAPETLSQVRTGFENLKVIKAIEVLDGCQSYLAHYIIRNPRSTSEEAMLLFADIIGSLEFYLETLKYTSQPNPRIMKFAKNSLLHLNRLKNE